MAAVAVYVTTTSALWPKLVGREVTAARPSSLKAVSISRALSRVSSPPDRSFVVLLS